VIGLGPYRPVAERYGVACAVAGFEPLDVLAGILSILKQRIKGEPIVDNTYRRVARDEGNPHARAVMDEVFRACDARWRGLGEIPGSGLALRDEFSAFDAGAIEVKLPPERCAPGCMCAEVVAGRAAPAECPLFACECTPTTPVGPCMVSSEGTCAAWYKYNR
ncbi:MAG TPA: hydrogenase formation protein HypD, partial [Alphaproteobacteria bacterium]|nr:hydrogenase formation protein HypD [Alphaproteobacteria bacterium]